MSTKKANVMSWPHICFSPRTTTTTATFFFFRITTIHFSFTEVLDNEAHYINRKLGHPELIFIDFVYPGWRFEVVIETRSREVSSVQCTPLVLPGGWPGRGGRVWEGCLCAWVGGRLCLGACSNLPGVCSRVISRPNRGTDRRWGCLPPRPEGGVVGGVGGDGGGDVTRRVNSTHPSFFFFSSLSSNLHYYTCDKLFLLLICFLSSVFSVNSPSIPT